MDGQVAKAADATMRGSIAGEAKRYMHFYFIAKAFATPTFGDTRMF